MTGNDIKAFRDRWGMTQVALAARLGVNHSTVWRWEHDEYPIPARIALALRGIAAELQQERPQSKDQGR